MKLTIAEKKEVAAKHGLTTYSLNMTKRADSIEELVETMIQGSTIVGVRDVLTNLGIDHTQLTLEEIGELLTEELTNKQGFKTTKDLYLHLIS